MREAVSNDMPTPSRVPTRDNLTAGPVTLPDLFRRAVDKHQLSDALNYKHGDEWTSISSAEMIAHIAIIARGLDALAFRRGDKAAILASNSPQWTLSDAGCQFAGLVDVPIYTTLAPAS